MAKIIISQQGADVREIELDKQRITIGRGAQNDIVLAHRAISGNHAVIETGTGDVVIEDLASTNGTLVNGRPIRKHVLQDRDIINLPETQIEFIIEAEFRHAMAELVADHDDEAALATVLPAVSERIHPAVVKVLSGANIGKQMSLTKALTTIGKPGVQVAVIQRRDAQYYLTHVEGPSLPIVNGTAIGQAPRLLLDGDTLELSGTQMVFIHH